MTQPRIIIVAGPNGAGKTTFARAFLPREADCLAFINADLIAAGLSPFAPEKVAIQAGRLMLQSIDAHVARRDSFALETTLSGMGYARQIPAWREAGYRVELHFLTLPDAETALTRVAKRVSQGGHNIPEDTVRRRFTQGRDLFDRVYQNLVDAWKLYHNVDGEPVLIDWKNRMDDTSVRELEQAYVRRVEYPAHLVGPMRAMMRAAQAARDIARQTGTKLVIVRDGKGVEVSPDELPPLPEVVAAAPR
jgi:predicted ABC-type ATPase